MGWLKRTRALPASATGAAAEFERLLREHVPALYRSAYRWTGTVDRAEDLVQQLLVRLYPRLAELRELDQVRPWALRVMYRIFVDQLRRERSSPVQFGVEPAADEEPSGAVDEAWLDPGPGPLEIVEQELTQERLLRAWAQLGEEHRVVLAMHDIEDYTLPELAAIMDIPLGTLKSRLHRARARLRQLLDAERLLTADRV
ncbi:MAG TPA: RNA polymerase sigma factor [Steroidobacteraceae bacterium]|nr:RNA polymerase sigma factor [Steroidobacteraceae bacterium]